MISVFVAIAIYMNKSEIYGFFSNLIKKENIIVLKDANEYKRKYNYDRFSNIESFIPNSISDLENIFYNILNSGWDDFIFYCPSEYEECADDVKQISSNNKLMSNIAGYISPYNSFSLINTTVSSYGEIYVKINKKYSDKEITDTNNKIKSIINELNIKNLSIEKKIKAYHDYLIKNATYDKSFAEGYKNEHPSTKANGALIEGQAVCGGYTDSMAIFLDILNIPNIIISSDTHTWNLVYLEDEWLHIDATWNDTENKNFEYEFYLINTDELLNIDTKEHTFSRVFFKEAN